MRKLIIAAAIALGSLSAASAMASPAVPQALASRIDKLPAEFTWSAAAERRHMIMRETERQQRYGQGPRRGYDRGYGPGPRYSYGPGPRHGYGPGPGPGYRRPPPPPYGYGPRW